MRPAATARLPASQPASLPQRESIQKMNPSAYLVLVLIAASCPAQVVSGGDDAHRVRSLLSNRCFACHGPDQNKRQGGLRFDKRESFLSEVDSGSRPVVPGNASESELMRRVESQDPDERMPPPEFGKGLTRQEVEMMRRWINDGARLPEHWSFVEPTRPALPQIELPQTELTAPEQQRYDDWLQHPVDRFLLELQLQHGLQPSAEAPRAELLRRLSLDLTGLPPTLEQVRYFEQNDAPDAYGQEVDRLLASPTFGEHWARKWLDLARYADSAGYADDPARVIWGYRDWVIDAINDNQSIQDFTIQQLAGDLLPDATERQMVATAFHRNTITNNEGGTNDEEFRNVAVVDRVNTTMAVWMGLTMACAQCHTHKYDPISQDEYFQVFAIFNQSQDADRKDESPLVELFTAQQMSDKQRWTQRQQAIEHSLDEITAEDLSQLAQWESQLSPPQWQSLVPSKMQSGDASTFESNQDGDILVRFPTVVSDQNKYSLEFELTPAEGESITAIGLRTIPRADLPGGGAGQGGGNFVVTNIRASLAVTADQLVSITFQAAYADYSQDSFGAKEAIDGQPASGWAVGGKVNESHLLTLIPNKPIHLSGSSVLRLEVDHSSPHAKHLLASFRVEETRSASAADWVALSPELHNIHLKPLADRTQAEQSKLASYYHRELAASTNPLRRELKDLEKKIAAIKPETSVPVMRDLAVNQRRETFVQIRGNYKSLGNKVQPGTPAIFLPMHSVENQEPNRLEFARWIVDRGNPLTARVWMNRLWETLFGTGIVRSSEDFGAQGDPPSHPQLLDWLACELMDTGWDHKYMLRLMVNSQAYRQSSRVSPEALALDFENKWLARGPRIRLSAEMVRDQALAAAGLLSHAMYGPPVRPPQPDMGLKAAFGSDTDWKTSDGENRYRRGLYTTWRRSNPYPSMATFDAPSRETCTLKRDSTNTPLQALVTLNDPSFVEAAQALSRRVVLGASAELDERARISLAFEICTCRHPMPEELDALVGLHRVAYEQFREDPQSAMKLATDPLGPIPAGADPILLATYTALCNVLLNLDEVLMKR